MSAHPIGRAWSEAAHDLEDELRRLDPDAVVSPRVDAGGLLKLDVRVKAEHRPAARAAVRRHETKANATCETCGSPTSTVQAGPVVQVLCVGCRG
ncbi:MAG TPA: hypothetical protein VG325_18495 [Solirubrobacteraceae bacterium]|nr:hypothetical protein [Solirubrobacteraceae bacterium]